MVVKIPFFNRQYFTIKMNVNCLGGMNIMPPASSNSALYKVKDKVVPLLN